MRILYVEGDKCSPKYVAGTLERAGAEVTRVVGEPVQHNPDEFDAILLSDTPVASLGEGRAEAIAEAVAAGTGLVVVGGWRSLGCGGYAGTTLGRILPVEVRDGDDRMNLPSGAFLRPLHDHAITRGLDFNAPPVLTGYNDCTPRGGSETILEGVVVGRVHEDRAELTGHDPFPLLVTDTHGDGRVAVFTGDLAPHWSGGLTDWGWSRVDVGQGEEVGQHYLRLVVQLLAWAGDVEVPAQAQRVVARH